MTQLFQSAFLQSLGYAIANSLWQMALVWLVYLCISNIRSLSAAVKYRMAVAAQAAGFVWFLVTFQFYYTQYHHALDNAATVSRNVQAILSANTDWVSRMVNWMVKGEELLPYVSVAYLLLIVFLAARWLFDYRQTQQMRANGLQKMPVEWRLFIDRVAEELGIGRRVKIFLSERIATPLTIGFLKPLILIPVASINHLSTDQMEAVLLHELAHIKRYDYLVNILLSVAEISLFFNPFTQLISKSIRKERENCCDDWVLQYQYDGSVYAEALLRIAYLQAAPSLAMTAAGGKKNELLTRVKRMIGEKENRFNYRKQLLAFVIVTGILGSIAWLNPLQHRNHNTNATVKTTKDPVLQYAVEPMTVRIDNPLFNPIFFLSKPFKEEMKKNIESAQIEIGEELGRVPAIDLPMQAIQTVSPLVASAMEQAAMALEHIDINDDAIYNEPAKARSDIRKKLYSDSAFFASNFNFPKNFVADLGNSMVEMEEGLKTARTEIAKTFKMVSGNKTNTAQDKERIENAKQDKLAELQKLNLGKDLAEALSKLGDAGVPFVEKITLNAIDLSTTIISDLKLQDLVIPTPKDPKATKKKTQKKTEEEKEILKID